ncbi:MAG TPA: hypothetical protein VKS03_03940 [Thermoanaerobaculia bacterium]|nr:hypothetical protein [Thermoanaerobaculia bacterium]
MKRFNLPAPKFFFIVATRAMLGTGVGLLVSDKLGRRQRRRVGTTLVAIGALTTIPAIFALLRSSSPEGDVIGLAS